MSDAWSVFEHDPRAAGNAGLRASDRDRDAAGSILGAAYAEGRLTREELDERAETLAAAKTLGELPALVSDVVPTAAVGRRPADPHAQAVEEYDADRRRAAWGFTSASVICWVIWLVTSINAGAPQFPWPLFVMLGTGLHLGRITVHRRDRIAELEAQLAESERRRLDPPGRGDDRPDGSA